MTFPVFASGDVLNASDMNGVGLWLVKTQTIATSPAPTSVVVTGAFSADYDNYLITVSGATMSVDTALKLQMGATTTGYYGNYIYGAYTATTVLGANDNNASAFTYGGGGADCFAYAIVGAPFLSKPTELWSRARYATNNGNYSGVLANTTSYTGFTLIPFSGTITGGTIRVYGIRN
jgi:hypothetical protein